VEYMRKGIQGIFADWEDNLGTTFTALPRVVLMQSPHAVKILIKPGAKIDAGQSARQFFEEVWLNNADTVKYLLG
jgi:hypothetical protein